jgi:hypothetical protein
MMVMKSRKNLLRITGYVILIISCLLFILIPVIPWLGFSVRQIAGITAGLVIAGEILFYLSLFILGRSFYDKIKNWLKFWKTKPKDTDITTDEL